MAEYTEIIDDIKGDSYLKKLWELYLEENMYIGNLDFESVIDALDAISKRINAK